jgi:hypothetical protein
MQLQNVVNITRLILSSIAGFLVYFVYGGVVTGMFLKKDYLPYANVYRPAEQIMKLFPFGMLTTLLAILVLSIIYAQSVPGSGHWIKGARFGALVGLFMVCAHVAHNYVNLNIGPKLALEMAIAELLQWTLVGTVMGAVYKPPGSS